MKCQRCGKPAVVHLTELSTDPNGQKQAMEVHLCLGHAAEMGIISPAAAAAQGGVLEAVTHNPLESLKSKAIVPKNESEMGLALSRSSGAKPEMTCGACGMTWSTFKQHGVLGCAQCYEMFEAKLMPLVKRAQENFGQHAGKVPPGVVDPARQVATARLRRELEQALMQENYEAAAKLRDELRVLGQN